jgi:homoserine O-succinyltransferase
VLFRSDVLTAKGFHVGAWSEVAGVDSWWREEPSLFVFLQGHPEYDVDTLVKEYRRDVLRFVAGERADYPDAPANIFSASTTAAIEQLRAHILAGKTPHAERALSATLSQETLRKSWEADTARLYRDWMRTLSERVDGSRAFA